MTSESSSAATPAKHADSFSRPPVTKVNALSRLKTFTGTIVSRKDKGPPIVFPPPSWDLDDQTIYESLWSRKGNKKVAQTSKAPASSNSVEESEEHPEPMTFAKKIREMIELLPVPSALTSTWSNAPAAASEFTPADEGRTGSPVPPGMDEGMVKMLSSEDLMNGTRSNKKGVERQSVWDTLAGINHDVHDQGSSQRPTPSKVEEQEDGVMMYVPLEPNEGSEVELAETESVLEHDKAPSHESASKNGITAEEPKPARTDIAVEKKVWVPSTTQISVFTTWWGYRLYLPPPVMEKLGSHSLKATARAAMITSALKWLIGKIPMMFVPVQFKPAVALLKRLSPVVGYVGIFIAWSWDRVRACDEGNGVVLSATWLLPVALLPMAWDAGHIYGPSLPKPVDAEKEVSKQSKKDNPPQKKRRSYFLW